MIDPTRGVSTPSLHAPLRSSGTTTEPRDSFRSGESAPTRPRMPNFISAPVISLKSLLKAATLGLVLAASMGSLAAPAYAASVEMHDNRGIEALIQEKLGHKPDTLATLRALPGEAVQIYRELGPDLKKDIAVRLQGSSGFLGIKVSHKRAFIDGTAWGKNAFDHLRAQMEEQVKKGEMSQPTFDQLSRALSAMSTLTPGQRGALVDLLEAELGLSR